VADYYVDPTLGADGNPGTEAQPWQTLGKVSTEFNAGTFGAGDTINLKRGETFTVSGGGTNQLYLKGSSGSFGNYITIQAYGAGSVRPHITGTLTGDNFLIGRWNGDANADYIHIEGLEISEGRGTGCILARDCSYWIIRDCLLHDSDQGGAAVAPGIQIQNSSHHIWIENCEIYNMEGEAVYIGNTTGDPQSDYTRQVTVRDCNLHDNNNEGVDLKGASTSCYIVDTTIENNGIGGGWDYTAIALGGEYHRVFNCRIKGSPASHRWGMRFFYTYGGEAVKGCRYMRVDHCLFDGCGASNYAALHMRGDDNVVANCTFVNCPGNAVWMYSHWWTGGGAQQLLNCIFDGASGYDVYFDDAEAHNLFTIDYNDYSDGANNIWWYDGASRNFAWVQATAGQEANGITTAADFEETTDYTLAAGSGNIDAGDSSVTLYDWYLEYGPGAPGATAVDIGWREANDWTMPNRVFRSQCDTLDDFTATNNAAVSAAAAYSGSNGIRVTLAGASDYVYRDSLGGLQSLYTRMYFNANGLTMASGDEFTIMEVQDNAGNVLGSIELDYDGSNVRVRASILDDAAVRTWTGYHDITAGDNWNQVELYWQASPQPAWGDWGEIILYLNAEEVDTVTGRNNDTRTASEIWFGAVSGQDAGTSGTLDIDLLYADEVREIGDTIDETDVVPPPFDPEEGEITVYVTWQDTYKSCD